MAEILNNLVIYFNKHQDIKQTFESFGIIFDKYAGDGYIVNPNSIINFSTIIMFLEELKNIDQFAFNKINNMYYLTIL